MKIAIDRASSILALVLAASLSPAHAALLTWDSGGTAAGGADGSSPVTPSATSGTWNTTNLNWSNGTADSAWNNSNNDTAVFTGTANFTLTIGAPVTAAGLQFDTTGSGVNVTVQSSTITLTAPTIKVTDINPLVTISSAISGSSGLTKTGSGGLQLSSASSNYTGATTLNGGSLRIGTTNGLSTAASLIMSNGTLEMQGNSQSVTALSSTSTGNTIRNRASGASVLTVTGSSTTNYTSSLHDAGLGKTLSFKLAGNGAVQTLSNVGNTYSGPTTVSAGTLIAGANSLASSIAANSAVTVNSSTDFITLAGNTLQNGDQIIFSGTTMPTGVTTGQPGTRYFVVNQSGNTFQVSATSGGAAIDLTTAGTTVAVSHYITGAFGIGNSAIVLGDAATTTNNSSAAVLTGGAFTIGRAVTIANQATTGTYAIGGNTANTSAFTGAVTANQSLTVSQVTGGTLNISGGITGASSGIKTLTFANAGAVNINTTAISDGATGTIAVTQSGAGLTTFNVANTFTGATTVNAGTLATGATGTFGAGDVSVAANASLTFGNNASIGDLKTLTFASTSNISLGFADAEIVGAVFNSVTSTFLAAGTYDATSLNSFFGNITAFSGTGSLTVSAVPEPATYAALAGVAILGFAALRRRRAGA